MEPPQKQSSGGYARYPASTVSSLVTIDAEHMAACRAVAQDETLIRSAIKIIISYMCRGGVTIDYSGQSKPTQADRDQCSMLWKHFMEDLWTSIWIYGWAAVVVSPNIMDWDGSHAPCVITDYSDITVQMIPTNSDRETRFFFLKQDSDFLGRPNEFIRQVSSKPVQGAANSRAMCEALVFCESRPTRSGKLTSRVASLLSQMYYSRCLQESQIVAARNAANPRVWFQPRTAREDSSNIPLHYEPSLVGQYDQIIQRMHIHSERTKRIQALLLSRQLDRIAREEQRSTKSAAPLAHRYRTDMNVTEDDVRAAMDLPPSFVANEHDLTTGLAATEPVNLLSVYRQAVDNVARVFQIPSPMLAAPDNTRSAVDKTVMQQWYQMTASLNETSTNYISVVWRWLHAKRAAQTMASLPFDSSLEKVVRAADDIKVCVHGEPPYDDVLTLFAGRVMKKSAFREQVARSFAIPLDDLEENPDPDAMAELMGKRAQRDGDSKSSISQAKKRKIH